MNTSWDGIKFICRREALVRVAYHDGNHPDGSPKYSIGFGSQTPLVKPGDTITTEEAFLRMMDHVAANDVTINKRLKDAVLQQEWDAIASLYYQSGSEPFRAVTEVFNTRQPSTWGVREFAEWHRESDGLLKRRLDEMAMARGYYGDLDTFKYFDGDPKTTIPREVPFPDEPMRTT